MDMKEQLPTRDGRKIKVKSKMMITLTSYGNWHFTDRQSIAPVVLEKVLFILPWATKSICSYNSKIRVYLGGTQASMKWFDE